MAIDFYILHLLLLPSSRDNVFLSFSSVIAGAVLKGGGVELLLGLATSLKEGIQKEATKTIKNLSVDPAFAISLNIWVAGEAATEIWNLSASDEHQTARALAYLTVDDRIQEHIALACGPNFHCAAFAPFQFTVLGARYARHHANLLQESRALGVLTATSTATAGPLEAKIFAKTEHQQMSSE